MLCIFKKHFSANKFNRLSVGLASLIPPKQTLYPFRRTEPSLIHQVMERLDICLSIGEDLYVFPEIIATWFTLVPPTRWLTRYTFFFHNKYDSTTMKYYYTSRSFLQIILLCPLRWLEQDFSSSLLQSQATKARLAPVNGRNALSEVRKY